MEKYKGITKPEEGSWAAHHIVPQGENYSSAAKARKILEEDWGISLDDADNGVYLTTDPNGPGAYHPEIHTNKYYDYVYKQLSGCTSEKEVRSVLQSIGQDLQNGVVIW